MYFLYPIEKVSGITSGISVVLSVVYQWQSVAKFGGITIGKTMDSSVKQW